MTVLAPPVLSVLGVLAASFAAAWLGTWMVMHVLRRRTVLDIPNERSSHSRPTPRGGGWGVVPVIVIAWLLLAGAGPASSVPVIIPVTAVGLAVISWMDDLHGLPASIRFAAHTVAVAAAVMALPEDALALQGLVPLPLDRIATALAWLWFVNLFNFMDGIDGLAGTEAVMVALGAAIVVGLMGSYLPTALPALILAGAAAGFLVWNWHPARVFMGDTGSVPLGFLIGWLLLDLAVRGAWAAALLLPGYFLADATLTLLMRLSRGERIWQAHREHFYQRAAQAGLSHSQTVGCVALANLLLIALAAISILIPLGWLTLIPGSIIVVMLLRRLAHRL